MHNDTIETMTPNQIVAYNVARARELRGWSQAQTVEKLRDRAGVITSPANLSAAERSVTGNRRREFDADDLLAFARAFELPVSWFLLPPAATSPLLSTGDSPDGLPPTLILDWLYRDSPEENQRVHELTQNRGDATNYQQAIEGRAHRYMTQLAGAALAEFNATPRALHALADAIEQALPRSGTGREPPGGGAESSAVS
jgi:transcriptional regulator with XRE-family HTH domain